MHAGGWQRGSLGRSLPHPFLMSFLRSSCEYEPHALGAIGAPCHRCEYEPHAELKLVCNGCHGSATLMSGETGESTHGNP